MIGVFNLMIIKILGQTLLYVGILDFLLKFLIKENCRYYFLHVLFNSWITYLVLPDAINSIINPFLAFENQYERSAIVSTASITGFHLYHMFAYSNLTIEDWLHHLVSAVFVAGLGIYLPFGKCPSLANLTMCGIPGGIDYFLLVLVKYNLINKMTEKFINRYLNLLIRWPIMFLASYIFFINVYHLNVDIRFLPIMILGMSLHCYNAIYYCDKVIGNYYLRKNDK